MSDINPRIDIAFKKLFGVEENKDLLIALINSIVGPESKEYHNVFHIAEKNTGLVYFKDLELHTLELKKFSSNSSDNLSDIVKKITKSLDIWLAFLTRNELLIADNLPKELDDKHLKKALKVLEIMNFSNQERDIYEDHLKWLRIEANTLKKAEEKGTEKGTEKGKLEIARNLIAKGFDDKTILEITGLSVQEIKNRTL